MSTRYVYEVYDTGAKARSLSSISIFYETTFSKNRYGSCKLCNSFTSEVAVNMDGKPVSYYKDVNGISFPEDESTPSCGVIEYYGYTYCILTASHGGTNNGVPVIEESYLIKLNTSHKAYWHAEIVGTATGGLWNGNGRTRSVWNSDSSKKLLLNEDGGDKALMSVTGGVIEKGTSLLGTESKNSYGQSGAFPYGSGWRWRVYKGSDSIDPSAVTYSKQDLYPGEPVTISVTPVTPTYGGTVSYLYQYSINGGSTWTTIGSKTTDTSVSVTIPEGATQFQARVTASDGWGFTSTTPVLGPSLGVSQLKAYATVGGKLRSGVKMYATVNGKIREIQKGYATIGGKIRKMF